MTTFLPKLYEQQIELRWPREWPLQNASELSVSAQSFVVSVPRMWFVLVVPFPASQMPCGERRPSFSQLECHYRFDPSVVVLWNRQVPWLMKHGIIIHISWELLSWMRCNTTHKDSTWILTKSILGQVNVPQLAFQHMVPCDELSMREPLRITQPADSHSLDHASKSKLVGDQCHIEMIWDEEIVRLQTAYIMGRCLINLATEAL